MSTTNAAAYTRALRSRSHARPKNNAERGTKQEPNLPRSSRCGRARAKTLKNARLAFLWGSIWAEAVGGRDVRALGLVLICTEARHTKPKPLAI
jgi:hypothetical protein